MKTVYVVLERSYKHDPYYVRGVYASRVSADARRKALILADCDGEWDDDWEESPDARLYHVVAFELED